MPSVARAEGVALHSWHVGTGLVAYEAGMLCVHVLGSRGTSALAADMCKGAGEQSLGSELVVSVGYGRERLLLRL